MRYSYFHVSAALLFGLTLACTSDDSGSTSESATSSSSASSSSSGSTGSTSSTSTSGSSDSATGSTSSDTTDSESSTSATSTSGTASTSTGDPTGTTGGGEACEDLGATDFGDCATSLGWIFDGNSCVALQGCDCGPHCDAIFASASECSGTCAAAGECNSDLLIGKGIAMGPFGVGDGCDEVTICGGPPMAVSEILPAVLCTDMAEYPCEGGGPGCTLNSVDPITDEQFQKLCAASLLPGVELIACVIWGP